MTTNFGNATDGSPIAPDGSPVGLYRMLPPGREPEIIATAAPPGAGILELGCGAGRITHALIAHGHPVVAVDQSADMLAHVRNARTVRGAIENLDLGETAARVVDGLLTATQECTDGTTTWTHSWTDLVLTDEEFTALVAEGGFSVPRWIDDEWALLHPLPR